MPPEWFEEVRPLLKNGVQTIIEKVEPDSDLPTQTFYQLSSGTLLPSASQFEVQAPGEFFEDKLLFDHFYEGELRKPAEIIFENLPDLPEDTLTRRGSGLS